jgi:hypothetical protein
MLQQIALPDRAVQFDDEFLSVHPHSFCPRGGLRFDDATDKITQREKVAVVGGLALRFGRWLSR